MNTPSTYLWILVSMNGQIIIHENVTVKPIISYIDYVNTVRITHFIYSVQKKK